MISEVGSNWCRAGRVNWLHAQVALSGSCMDIDEIVMVLIR